MKKALFLLLIVFVMGGVYFGPLSVTGYSVNLAQTPPSPAGGGAGAPAPPSKVSPKPSTAKVPPPELHTQQPGAPVTPSASEQRQDLQDKIANVETCSKSLNPDGDRAPQVKQLTSDIKQIKQDLNKKPPVFEDIRGRIPGLMQLCQQLAAPIGTVLSTPTVTPLPTATPRASPDKEGGTYLWWEWLIYGLIGLAILGGIGAGIYFLLKGIGRERAAIRATFSDLKIRDGKLNDKLETLTKITTDLSNQISKLKSEIIAVRQGLANQPPYASQEAPPPLYPKEQQRFPVAVEDYLAQVQGSQPVRFDYTEGLIVPDADGAGGMFLVKDDGELYLVPSFKFLQTRDNYTTYLSRYFDCAKPMAGTVWIRRPATVTVQDGGWQIAQKGELEVR